MKLKQKMARDYRHQFEMTPTADYWANLAYLAGFEAARDLATKTAALWPARNTLIKHEGQAIADQLVYDINKLGEEEVEEMQENSPKVKKAIEEVIKKITSMSSEEFKKAIESAPRIFRPEDFDE